MGHAVFPSTTRNGIWRLDIDPIFFTFPNQQARWRFSRRVFPATPYRPAIKTGDIHTQRRLSQGTWTILLKDSIIKYSDKELARIENNQRDHLQHICWGRWHTWFNSRSRAWSQDDDVAREGFTQTPVTFGSFCSWFWIRGHWSNVVRWL
jgi:hypothetical protein